MRVAGLLRADAGRAGDDQQRVPFEVFMARPHHDHRADETQADGDPATHAHRLAQEPRRRMVEHAGEPRVERRVPIGLEMHLADEAVLPREVGAGRMLNIFLWT